jgi:hypothetical protein
MDTTAPAKKIRDTEKCLGCGKNILWREKLFIINGENVVLGMKK